MEGTLVRWWSRRHTVTVTGVTRNQICVSQVRAVSNNWTRVASVTVAYFTHWLRATSKKTFKMTKKYKRQLHDYNQTLYVTSSRLTLNWMPPTWLKFFSATSWVGLRRNMRCHCLVAVDSFLIWTGSTGVLRAVFIISSIMRLRPRGISVSQNMFLVVNT